jgi:hypothetical protein
LIAVHPGGLRNFPLNYSSWVLFRGDLLPPDGCNALGPSHEEPRGIWRVPGHERIDIHMRVIEQDLVAGFNEVSSKPPEIVNVVPNREFLP